MSKSGPEVFWLGLHVNPEPWTMGVVSVGRRNGKIAASVGVSAQLASYQEAIREAAEQEWRGPLLQGDIALHFFFWRNLASYRTPSGRLHRKHRPDATNAQKATEDALQGIVFENDRSVVDVHSTVVDQGADVEGYVVVKVWEVTPEDRLRTFMELPQGIVHKLAQDTLGRQQGRAETVGPPIEDVF